MHFGYKFSNLLGTVYRGGDLLFTSSNDAVMSPVGNKLSIYDLKAHRFETLPIESVGNICSVDVNPSETALMIIDEFGHAFYISMVAKIVLYRYHFPKKVQGVKFSPDGRFFAISTDTNIVLFRAPDINNLSQKPFFIEHVFRIAQDTITWLEWSEDSKFMVTCSADTQVRICMVDKPNKLMVLTGHSHPPVFCSFASSNYDVYTCDRSGLLIHWSSEKMVDFAATIKELTSSKDKAAVKKLKLACAEKLFYQKLSKHHLIDASECKGAKVTCARLHKASNLLITGLSNGSFLLHELPKFFLIQSISISNFPINSVAFNSSGEWIAVASSRLGQLLVWEWQSETYVMKQQGHFHSITCASYSPNGGLLASGGHDGKVKLWNVDSGFCFVTFDEHKGDVTGVCWTQAGQAILSCSLDGTVRAFSLKRYRNFRTFVSPEPVQFGCLCVDVNGEIVCAGGRDVFNIYVWSMSSGRLLDMLSGHQAPISAVTFCPTESVLASSSWDKQVIVWNVFEGKGGREPLDCCSEVFDVKFSPAGDTVACCCLNSQILLFDWRSGSLVHTIEGKLDLETFRGDREITTAEKSGQSKAFTTISFSPDGEYILAAGKSPFICLYHVSEQMVVKRFKVTTNRSIDCVDNFVDRKKLSEFGNLALIDHAEDDELSMGKRISIPGFRSNDPAIRSFKPSVLVTCVQFCPTGRSWVACTNEGLLIYSLDIRATFDPFQLDTNVLPANVHELLKREEFCEALMMALKLNEPRLIVECLEKTPVGEIDCVCRALPDAYAERAVNFIGEDQMMDSVHVEFYLIWVRAICLRHGINWKLRMGPSSSAVTKVHQRLTLRQKTLGRICDNNMYTLRYILSKMEGEHDECQIEEVDKESLSDQLMDVGN